MPITRRLLAQDDNDDNQWLKVDHSSRYIINDMDEWQFLFGVDSTLSTSQQVVKIAARFDDNTFNNIQLTSYLYDQKNASIANASNCELRLYKVEAPNWSETLIITLPTTQLVNYYFYANPTLLDIGLDFRGGDTLMIESHITRLGITYRDRVYVNHLGIYDTVLRVKRYAEFLDLTKLDE